MSISQIIGISIDKTAKTIEADYYPAESATAHHIAVDFVSGDILSATNPDLFEANIVYEAQACEELLRYMNTDQAVDTLEVKWK